jgi:pimeloyl-ACP methyl ester carboxylesterase
MPPNIVLVHGAMAESSSWDAVSDLLLPATVWSEPQQNTRS